MTRRRCIYGVLVFLVVVAVVFTSLIALQKELGVSTSHGPWSMPETTSDPYLLRYLVETLITVAVLFACPCATSHAQECTPQTDQYIGLDQRGAVLPLA
jgi:ABC-type Fe3+ transport system permease subunit